MEQQYRFHHGIAVHQKLHLPLLFGSEGILVTPDMAVEVIPNIHAGNQACKRAISGADFINVKSLLRSLSEKATVVVIVVFLLDIGEKGIRTGDVVEVRIFGLKRE